MVTRISVSEVNRENVLNYIKINHPNYVLVDTYEMQDRDRVFLSNRAEELNGLNGPVVVIEMDGDVTLKIRKEDYQKKGNKIIPVYLTEQDFCDLNPCYKEMIAEIKNVMPAEKVYSFKNFEIRNGKVHQRENNIRSGETVFIVR